MDRTCDQTDSCRVRGGDMNEAPVNVTLRVIWRVYSVIWAVRGNVSWHTVKSWIKRSTCVPVLHPVWVPLIAQVCDTFWQVDYGTDKGVFTLGMFFCQEKVEKGGGGVKKRKTSLLFWLACHWSAVKNMHNRPFFLEKLNFIQLEKTLWVSEKDVGGGV